MNHEPIIKAEQAVSLALGDLREAHREACYAHPVLALFLADRIAEAAALQSDLALLVSTLGDTDGGAA